MSDQLELDESVCIMPYDPSWVALFEQEAGQLRGAVGTMINKIEHIGSTAVPGLISKPIVDILVGVTQSIMANEIAKGIVTLGFQDMGEAGMEERRYLRKRGVVLVNVHVVQVDSELWRNNLLIRDYLRTHSDEVERYGKHKLEVINNGARTLLAYSERKFKFMQDLLQRAQAWDGRRS